MISVLLARSRWPVRFVPFQFQSSFIEVHGSFNARHRHNNPVPRPVASRRVAEVFICLWHCQQQGVSGRDSPTCKFIGCRQCLQRSPSTVRFAVGNESALFNKASARPSVRWQAADSRKSDDGEYTSRCIAFLIDFFVWWWGKGTEYWYQWVCILRQKSCCMLTAELLLTFAVLLQMSVQCYCKPFTAPVIQTVCSNCIACSVFAVGSWSVYQWWMGVIQQSGHSPRRWHISTPLQPLYPRPSVDCALPTSVISSICGKSRNNRFVIRPRHMYCYELEEGLSSLPSQLYVHRHSSRCRLRRVRFSRAWVSMAHGAGWRQNSLPATVFLFAHHAVMGRAEVSRTVWRPLPWRACRNLLIFTWYGAKSVSGYYDSGCGLYSVKYKNSAKLFL